MRRDRTGKHYDLVGRACEAELRVDVAGHQLLLHLCSGKILKENSRGDFIWRVSFEDYVWPIDLPGDMGLLDAKSGEAAADDAVRLSARAKKFLAESPSPCDLDRKPSAVDRKLAQAFGADCDEVRERTIKLDHRASGLVLAADQFTIEGEGRIQFRPFSMAIFNKDQGATDRPAITVLRSKYGFVKLDGPITSIFDLGKRKILAVEVLGGFRVVFERP
jgi:hypothetical protein